MSWKHNVSGLKLESTYNCGNLLKRTLCELHIIAHFSTSSDDDFVYFYYMWSVSGSTFTQSLGSCTLDSVLQDEHLQLPGWQVQLVQVQEALEQAIVKEVWVGMEKVK